MIRLNAQGNMEKEISKLADKVFQENKDNYYIPFECPQNYEGFKTDLFSIGRIKKENEKISIDLIGTPKNFIDKVLNEMGEKSYQYSIENTNHIYSYNPKLKLLEHSTDLYSDVSHLVEYGLKQEINNFNDFEYKYINSDEDGVEMKATIKNNIIENLEYEGLKYSKGMDKEAIKEQLETLKYNELGKFNKALSDKRFSNEENSFLIEELEMKLEKVASEMFLYDYAGDETVYIVRIPENYTDFEVASSIAEYIGKNDTILNLTSENEKLIPIIQNYTNALNEYQKVNITLNQPEDVVFNLDIGKIDVELKKDFPKNLSESIQFLNTYKNVCNPDNCIDITLHKEGKPILGNSYYEEHSQNKAIVNEAFNLWSQKEVDASLIKEAKQISDYENKDFFIFDEFNSIELLISKGKIELQPDNFKLLNVPLKEKNQKMKDFAQKVRLDRIFEEVIYIGVENNQDNQKEFKMEKTK